MTEVLRNRIRWACGVSGGVILIILLWQNREFVVLRLFFWDLAVPKLLLMVIGLLAGVVVGLLIAKRWSR